MALAPGAKLGVYEIVESIGAGGMGQVYRARDTKLGRDVAIKVLLESFAQDPDRLARFEREARTLASLNHPNIAVIYGLEETGSVRALVMELVGGQDLSTLIAAGHATAVRPALTLDDSLRIARQIADALEAAHELGIVHRDLKPANVRVTDAGVVKVLDFGLAKALDPVRTDAGGSTMTSPAMTAMGMILGTAAYMSPEQARGKPVDRRADIWAFGCVLFEMLSGRRPFAGEDISDVLASVLKDEPAWSALPADLPESVRRLLRRCLEKDPRRRLSAIGDARLELDEPALPMLPASPIATVRSKSSGGSRWWIAAGVAVAAVGSLAAWTGWFRTPVATSPLMRVTVMPPQGHPLFRDSVNMAISPDGKKLAFLTGVSYNTCTLWIRSLDRLDAHEVEDSTTAQLPFWSWDSESVGFFAGGKLKVVKAAGGRPQVLVEGVDGRGGTWNRNGDIVFARTNSSNLSRVSQNAGAVTSVTELRAADGELGHRFPTFLPDGDHFLFAALPGRSAQYDIYIGSLSSPDRQRLFTSETAPVYAAPGFLIYARAGVLVAHPFDADTRTLRGEAVPIGDTPGELTLEYSAGAAASVSRDGGLAYLSASEFRSRLVWLDLAGRETGAVDVPLRPYGGVALSPDGRHAVVTEFNAGKSNLSLVDLARGGLTPLTAPDGLNNYPVWSTDSRRIVYGSDRNGAAVLYLRNIDSAEERLLYSSPGLFKHPQSWSADGKTIVFATIDPKNDDDLWSIHPDDGKPPVPVLGTPADEAFGAISPDSKWLAYISSKAGRLDLYVQPYPAGADVQRITTTGTLEWGVWWKRDGSQLLVLDANLNLLLVDVRTSPSFVASAPRAVGQLRFLIQGGATIDVAPDLSRLLAIVPEQVDGARSITVVLNWRAAIAK